MTNQDRQDMIDGITQLAIVKRKAAAFDAMVEHSIHVVLMHGKWKAYDRYHATASLLYDTPLEAVEAAVNATEET